MSTEPIVSKDETVTGVKPQRLVLCLDGTWNNKDASTNVFHLYNLAAAGEIDGVYQRKHYLEGVGTGVLDSVTGGGFGFGLEENVRAACDWLIEHYNDGDEIFIFGFSRGAFTARSLVAFIARCGLLRRGAPITMNELWQAYRILGRSPEHRQNWWEKAFGVAETTFRKITNLKAGDSKLTLTEQLLMTWSRRVDITCLGVFDTVASMGWDAFSIPGLRSRMGSFHNMNLTTLIKHGYQALALDEHRSNFTHIPLAEFVPADQDFLKFAKKIEQCWFVGSHSNVGGGYESNPSATITLRWMAENAQKRGMALEPKAWALVKQHADWAQAKLQEAGPQGTPPLRDSYKEFANPLWAHLLRAKRSYRTVAPHPEANGPLKPEDDSGFSIVSVNETVDKSVEDFVSGTAHLKGHESYAPANLLGYARRSQNAKLLEALKDRCGHRWAARTWEGRFWLLLWCLLAGIGFEYVRRLFCPGQELSVRNIGVVAVLLTLVDWRESKLVYLQASDHLAPFDQAGRDGLYWLRALGGVMMFIGAPALLIHLLNRIWHWQSSLHELCDEALQGLAILAAVFVASLIDGLPGKAAPKVGGLTLPEKIVIGLFILTGILLAPYCWVQWHGTVTKVATSAVAPGPAGGTFAGNLLLAIVAFIYFANSFWWVGEPLEKARLGSIIQLQLHCTSAGIKKQLDKWATFLRHETLPGDESGSPKERAARELSRVVREALWRDILGYIPIYTLLMAAGFWFAQTHLKWSPWWFALWGLPLITAVADWLEDAIEWYYVRHYAEKVAVHSNGGVDDSAPSQIWVTVCIAATLVKMGGFILGITLTEIAIFVGGWHLLTSQEQGGWRGALALLGAVIVLVMLLFKAASFIRGLFTSRKKKIASAATSPIPKAQT